MTAITDGITTLHPKVWTKYRSGRETNTKVHPLASGTAAITLAPHGPREVTVALVFDDETESAACETMHARPGVLTITEPGRDTHSMQYVVTGRVERELNETTAREWLVSAEVTEVSE